MQQPEGMTAVPALPKTGAIGDNVDNELSHRARLMDIELMIQRLINDFERRMDKVDLRNEVVDKALGEHIKNVERVEEDLRDLARSQQDIRDDIKAIRDELRPYIEKMNDAAAVSRFLMWFFGVLLSVAGLALAWIRGKI